MGDGDEGVNPWKDKAVFVFKYSSSSCWDSGDAWGVSFSSGSSARKSSITSMGNSKILVKI